MEALASGRPPALQQLPGSSISADAVAEGGGGSGGVAAAADAEDGFVSGPEAAGALVEDSESLGRQGRSARERRLSTGSVSLGRPAGARPPAPELGFSFWQVWRRGRQLSTDLREPGGGPPVRSVSKRC